MTNRFFLVLCVSLGLMWACTPSSSLEVGDLKCDHLSDPLAIDNTTPRFSWILQSPRQGAGQTAYQLLVASEKSRLTEKKADLWNSGKVVSDQSNGIVYNGQTLQSRSGGYWKVRVWDETGTVSDWSEPARFGVGLLEPQDWQACYIGMEQPQGKSISPLLYKRFACQKRPKNALLHVNSLGYHEVYINGKNITDAVLSPAVSQFNKHSLVVTYDVSNFLRKGDNDVVILTGKGWYQEGLPGVVAGGPYVRAQLESQEAGTWKPLLVTDQTWLVRNSGYESFGDWRPHRFGGETVIASELLPDFSDDVLERAQWQPVKVVDIPDNKALPQMVELNRIQETFHPVSYKADGDSSWIFDMGTNFTGWTRIEFPPLQANQKIRISYCDFLDEKGNFRDGAYEDYYIASGGEKEHFINKFNYKAYRYLKLSNVSQAPELTAITASLIHTDYSGKSTFRCSDDDLNAIYNMIHYTLRCLTLGGYMVDCPQIERLGYGGDGNASTQTVQTLFNLAPLYANWMQAWADCMREDGSMPHTAPNPYGAGGGPYWCGFIITASWATYQNYGDSRILERYYPYMQKWLEYVAKYTQEGLLKAWPDTDYRNWYLGDWATPTGVDQTHPQSVDLVNNCFISVCFRTMSKIAALLGREQDARMYEKQSDELNTLIHTTFYDNEQKSYGTGTQIDLIYPMLAGVTPQEEIPHVVNTLYRVTDEKYKGHLATGLVGIPVMTEWAVLNGQADFIYRMLKKRDYPGYLYMLDNGATTTWEHWNGDRSRIHNCYNGIGSWFYQSLGGIRTDEKAPGYKHIVIQPRLVEGISWVDLSKDTPYGALKLRWEKDDTTFSLNVHIPVGSTATVWLPVSPQQLTVNGQEREVSTSLELSSGDYRIGCTL